MIVENLALYMIVENLAFYMIVHMKIWLLGVVRPSVENLAFGRCLTFR
jgi:hypothetical protein